MSSAAFEAYLGRRRRSADPGCEVGESGAPSVAAVLRRRQLPKMESCPEQVMTAKLAVITGEEMHVVNRIRGHT